MAGILIIAHAPLASALKECVAHIYGGLPARIGAIDVLPDCDPVQIVALAHSEIDRLREENGILVLTDMFGATPANIASRLATLPGVRVLAGVNLPMLVRGVCYRTCDLDTLVDKALAGAAKGVHAIGPLVAQTDGCKPAGEAECAPPGVPIVTPSNLSTAAPSEAACPSACGANPNGNPR
ncbi:PTS sugar transporter subunit IIA [Trinickia dinghuensis]|uniref:PTS mannose transporter subunit IIA n=1 Tax=Trinickia dinghuensis TaxID=2291023 RepID=A0A3D8K444_9BURK|nr:PTS mannose transporter subunit IIA [Trinickia dinghuensis]RDU99940.1 PTS mannose transporter subunit IIA [Trinickia dinghuensis]